MSDIIPISDDEIRTVLRLAASGEEHFAAGLVVRLAHEALVRGKALETMAGRFFTMTSDVGTDRVALIERGVDRVMAEARAALEQQPDA